MKQISRRAFTLGATKLGLGAGALSVFSVACQQQPPPVIRIGINGGQQPLFRYIAGRRDDILKPMGYTTAFTVYRNEAEMRNAFKNNQLDVIASLLPTAAAIHLDDVAMQIFGSIAWVADTLPVLVYSGAEPQKLTDLKGLRLAVSSKDDPGLAYYRAFALANDRLRFDTDVHLVDKPQDIATAMIANPTVDALVANAQEWNLLRGYDAFRTIATLGAEWQRFAPNRPPVVFGALAARRQWIGQNTKFINDFVKAVSDGFAAFKNERDAFNRRITQQTVEGFPQMTTEDVTATATYLGMDAVSADRVGLNSGDADDIAKLLETMASAGGLPRAISNVKEFVFTTR